MRQTDTLAAFSARQTSDPVTGQPGVPRNDKGDSKTPEGSFIDVLNTADYAIRVRGRAHFFQVDRALKFDRAAALGMRLDCVFSSSMRFQPGEIARVHLVRLGSTRHDGSRAPVDRSAQPGEVRQRGLRLAL